MGTRHLTVVIHQKRIKTAQYGQWDGYPDGQGRRIVTFLKKANIERFKLQLQKVQFLNDEDEKNVRDYIMRIGSQNGMLNGRQNRLYKARYPTLHRDTGAKILSMIYRNNAQTLLLSNSYTFARDSLFCEWCYVIDLDNNVLEIYKGGNEQPLTPSDRFYCFQRRGKRKFDVYYPVKLVKSFKIDKLPNADEFCDEMKEFLLLNKKDISIQITI